MSAAAVPGQTAHEAATTSAAKKSSRIISCVRCQQRKIKCDRQDPCNNCLKSRLHCISSASLGPKQRRRRLPERELLERLRYYEGLLRQNNIKWDANAPGLSPPSAQASLPRPEPASNKQSPESTDSPSDKSRSKNIWHALNDRLNDSDDASSEGDDDDIIKQADMRNAWDAFDLNDSLLFGTGDSFVNRATLHPNQIQIFRLWQIFIDNVEPLVQLLHVPSMQKRIIEASADVTKLDTNFEALMFAVYCMAVKSMTAEDCLLNFGVAQEYLLVRYQYACQQALFAANFHRTTNRECLTALYFYLMTLKQAVHVVSLSAMLGTAVRIARRLGYHSETANSKCEPFEAEFRRRLWYAIVHYDGRICEMADHAATWLVPTWDCRPPLNLHNFDLRPDMQEEPVAQEQPAESVLPATRALILDMVRHSDWHLHFVDPALKPIARPASVPGDGTLEGLEAFIEEKYLKLCNPQIPLQLLTLWTTRCHLARLRLAAHYARPAAMRGSGRDTTYWAQKMLDYDAKLKTTPSLAGFSWYTDLNFPFIAWMYLAQDVKRHPLGPMADETWRVMQENYDARGMGNEHFANPFAQLFMRLVDTAWQSRASSSEADGITLSMPPMVVSAMEKLSLSSQANTVSSLSHNSIAEGAGMENLSLSKPTKMDTAAETGADAYDWTLFLDSGIPMNNPIDIDDMAGEFWA